VENPVPRVIDSPQGAIGISGASQPPGLGTPLPLSWAKSQGDAGGSSPPSSDYARAMPRTARLVAGSVAVAVLLTGCGEEPEEVIDVGARITTAADALECPTGSEVEEQTISTGSHVGSEDALGAVQAWAKRARRSADIPLDGYHVSVEEVGTVLFTHSTNGLVEIAVIAARTDDENGDLGWLVSSWARCRPPGSSST